MPTLRIPSRTPAVIVLALAVFSLSCAPAFADAISDKKAQAAAVQTQITALNTKVEIAAEDYNAARDRYDAVSGKVAASARRISALQARTKTLQTSLNGRAVRLYREGPLGFVAVLLNARTFDDFNTTLQLLTNISSQDADTVAQLKRTKREAVAVHASLKASQADASREKAAMAASANSVRAQLASRQRLLASVNSDIRRLVAAEQARLAAEARARAAALLARQRAAAEVAARAASTNQDSNSGAAGTPSTNRAPSNGGGNPPTSSKGAAAVWWAEKALGCPYQWAAAGPDSFDCSGLVMWAYAHVGVSLPHSSREQIGCGAPVSGSNLQPGDLVFFGSPIHHVGMYVGNGQFIEAPYTGANVRISTLLDRGDFAGACRP